MSTPRKAPPPRSRAGRGPGFRRRGAEERGGTPPVLGGAGAAAGGGGVYVSLAVGCAGWGRTWPLVAGQGSTG